VRLFSDEWFDALEHALARIDTSLLPGGKLALGQIVTGAPAGEIRYTLCFGGHEPATVVRGEVSGALVTLLESYETARAIASGTPVADLLAAGKVKVRGDTNALLGAQESFGPIAEALVALSESTEV
jgi:hypothetical protein